MYKLGNEQVQSEQDYARTLHANEYILNHLIHHLTESRKFAQLFDLVENVNWRDIKRSYGGTDASFADDLELAFNCLPQEKEFVSRAIGFSFAISAIRSDLESLPSEYWKKTLSDPRSIEDAINSALMLPELKRSAALRRISVILAEVDQLERAETLIDLMNDPRGKVRTLRDIGLTLWRGEQRAKSEHYFQRAINQLVNVQNVKSRSSDQREIAKVLAESEHIGWALDLAKKIETPLEASRAFQEITAFADTIPAARSSILELATLSAHKVESLTYRIQLFRDIALKFFSLGEVSQAQDCVSYCLTIVDLSKRYIDRANLLIYTSQAQYGCGDQSGANTTLQRAVAYSEKIDSVVSRISCLRKIILEYHKMENLRQCQVLLDELNPLVEKIQNKTLKRQALTQLAILFIGIDRLDKMSEVVESFNGKEGYALVTLEIVKALIKSGRTVDAMHWYGKLKPPKQRIEAQKYFASYQSLQSRNDLSYNQPLILGHFWSNEEFLRNILESLTVNKHVELALLMQRDANTRVLWNSDELPMLLVDGLITRNRDANILQIHEVLDWVTGERTISKTWRFAVRRLVSVGRLEDARLLIAEIRQHQIKDEACLALIAGYCDRQEYLKAHELLGLMSSKAHRDEGIRKIAASLAANEKIEEAVELIETSNVGQPKSYFYADLVELLATRGDFEEVDKYLNLIIEPRSRQRALFVVIKRKISLGNLDLAAQAIASLSQHWYKVQCRLFLIREFVSRGQIQKGYQLLEETMSASSEEILPHIKIELISTFFMEWQHCPKEYITAFLDRTPLIIEAIQPRHLKLASLVQIAELSVHSRGSSPDQILTNGINLLYSFPDADDKSKLIRDYLKRILRSKFLYPYLLNICWSIFSIMQKVPFVESQKWVKGLLILIGTLGSKNLIDATLRVTHYEGWWNKDSIHLVDIVAKFRETPESLISSRTERISLD